MDYRLKFTFDETEGCEEKREERNSWRGAMYIKLKEGKGGARALSSLSFELSGEQVTRCYSGVVRYKDTTLHSTDLFNEAFFRTKVSETDPREVTQHQGCRRIVYW